MRQCLGVLLALLLAGCAFSESPPAVAREPQHALWFGVPNPTDHTLTLDITDTFVFGAKADNDVIINMRLVVVASGERVVSDSTRTVKMTRGESVAVYVPVLHPYEVQPQSVQRLSLRVLFVHQSIPDAVQIRIEAAGLTITDHTRDQVDPGPRQESVTEKVY